MAEVVRITAERPNSGTGAVSGGPAPHGGSRSGGLLRAAALRSHGARAAGGFAVGGLPLHPPGRATTPPPTLPFLS